MKRCAGYYAVRSPFTSAQSVCDISATSTYFGINVGYAFVGLPKTFYRRAYWQERGYLTFDNSKPVHSLSLTFNSAFATGSVPVRQGVAEPKAKVKFTPDFALKYNCTIAKGFGISAEVPIGLFNRHFDVDWSGSIPADTVWANGAVGVENMYGNSIITGDFYSGFALRASYTREIHRNVTLQSELGVSFTPLLHGQEAYSDMLQDWTAIIYPNDDNGYAIPFAKIDLAIYPKSYWLPNLSGSLNFLVHGRNPQHNFVFGLNFNVDFSKRMTIDYATVPSFPAKYQSSGQVAFNMTTIGVHVGYQFMTGRRRDGARTVSTDNQ